MSEDIQSLRREVRQLRERLKKEQSDWQEVMDKWKDEITLRARVESDLEACRSAYAHVCNAIVEGPPGGAGAMAVMVDVLKKERKDARKAYSHLRSLAQMAMNLSSDATDDEILALIATTWDERDDCLELLREAEKTCVNPVAMRIRGLLKRLAKSVEMMDAAKG